MEDLDESIRQLQALVVHLDASLQAFAPLRDDLVLPGFETEIRSMKDAVERAILAYRAEQN